MAWDALENLGLNPQYDPTRPPQEKRNGGIGKVLGDIADTLLMLEGGRPLFKEQRLRKEMTEAARQAPDRESLGKALLGIDFNTGNEYYKDDQAIQLAKAKEAREAGSAQISDIDKRVQADQRGRQVLSSMLRGALDRDPESRKRILEEARKYASSKNIPLDIADDYDSAAVEALGISPDDFVRLEETRTQNANTRADRAHDNAIARGRLQVDAALGGGRLVQQGKSNDRGTAAEQGKDARANRAEAGRNARAAAKSGPPPFAPTKGAKQRNKSTGELWYEKDGKWVK